MKAIGQVLVLAGLLGALTPLQAQDPRDALVARAFGEFDTPRRLQLLTSALNPSAGPPRGAWPVGVQLLAQTLIEEEKDSLAGVWLRWAVRLSPDLQVDTVQFLPEVATSYAAAHQFVGASKTGADSLVATTWLWPPEGSTATRGRLQVTAPTVGEALRASAEGAGVLAPGTPTELEPGSYRVSASAAGFDSLSVTREVLPGVTTVLELRPRRTAIAAAEQQRIPAANTAVDPQPKKKKFPLALVLGGAAAAGVVVALAAGGDGGGGVTPPPPATTGGITLTFPNP